MPHHPLASGQACKRHRKVLTAVGQPVRCQGATLAPEMPCRCFASRTKPLDFASSTKRATTSKAAAPLAFATPITCRITMNRPGKSRSPAQVVMSDSSCCLTPAATSAPSARKVSGHNGRCRCAHDGRLDRAAREVQVVGAAAADDHATAFAIHIVVGQDRPAAGLVRGPQTKPRASACSHAMSASTSSRVAVSSLQRK